MKRSRFSDEQIIAILSEVSSGKIAKEVCAQHNISQQTLYNWKRKFGDMDISEARKMRSESPPVKPEASDIGAAQSGFISPSLSRSFQAPAGSNRRSSVS